MDLQLGAHVLGLCAPLALDDSEPHDATAVFELTSESAKQALGAILRRGIAPQDLPEGVTADQKRLIDTSFNELVNGTTRVIKGNILRARASLRSPPHVLCCRQLSRQLVMTY